MYPGAGIDAMQAALNYDTIAPTYDLRYRSNDYSEMERNLLRFVGDEPQQNVLEVGCGTGHWLALLNRNGVRAAGVDVSAEMLARAKRNAPAASLVRGQAEQLPVGAGSCRRLFCINAFHHFTDRHAFLREAYRVLRPGGAFMTVGLDPHTATDRWFIYDYFDGACEVDKARFPAAEAIREWLSEAGFTGCRTVEVQRFTVSVPARQALEQGRLDRSVTSQLAMLTDRHYRHGLDQVQAEATDAEARGETLHLTTDLRLYATIGLRD